MFGLLLLGLQRLETDGVLTPAHPSMLEDMLENWTFKDVMLSVCQAAGSDHMCGSECEWRYKMPF